MCLRPALFVILSRVRRLAMLPPPPPERSMLPLQVTPRVLTLTMKTYLVLEVILIVNLFNRVRMPPPPRPVPLQRFRQRLRGAIALQCCHILHVVPFDHIN